MPSTDQKSMVTTGSLGRAMTAPGGGAQPTTTVPRSIRWPRRSTSRRLMPAPFGPVTDSTYASVLRGGAPGTGAELARVPAVAVPGR